MWARSRLGWCASWASARLPPAIPCEVPIRVIGLAVVLTVSFMLAPLVAEAQQAGKVWRIGPTLGSAATAATEDAFRQGLRERGYVEGRDVVVDWRFAEGKGERLPELAAELLRLKVDVIVTLAPAAVVAAQKATSDTPIVFTMVDDPVAMRLVHSLGRPGGEHHRPCDPPE